jgi:hypothetical protein
MINRYIVDRIIEVPPFQFRVDSTLPLAIDVNFTNISCFVLCHEMGHFFNGDLDNAKLFSAFGNSGLAVMNTNLAHSIEHAADASGFAILKDSLAAMAGKKTSELLLSHVANLFTMLKDLGSIDSRSHPDPHKRLFYIAETYYSSDLASALRAYYAGNTSKLESYIKDHCVDARFTQW